MWSKLILIETRLILLSECIKYKCNKIMKSIYKLVVPGKVIKRKVQLLGDWGWGCIALMKIGVWRARSSGATQWQWSHFPFHHYAMDSCNWIIIGASTCFWVRDSISSEFFSITCGTVVLIDIPLITFLVVTFAVLLTHSHFQLTKP